MLKVSDIKNFTYCKRQIYFEYVMPVETESTSKMNYGKAVHAKLDELEEKRNFKRFGLSEGEKIFHMDVYSQKHDIGGTIDMVIKNGDIFYPVEFKSTFSGVNDSSKMQVVAYATILEDMLSAKIDKGFIQTIPEYKVHEVNISQMDREKLSTAIEEINEIIYKEYFPQRVRNISKCNDCEYRRFCADFPD